MLTVVVAITSVMTSQRVLAFEASPNQAYGGAFIGSSAAMPPEGIYCQFCAQKAAFHEIAAALTARRALVANETGPQNDTMSSLLWTN